MQHVQILNNARKAAAAANPSFYTTSAKFLQATEGALVVSKPPLLTLLSNGGQWSTPQRTVTNAGFQPNEKLVDVLSCAALTAGSDGSVEAKSTDGAPMVSGLRVCQAEIGY